MGIPYAIFVLKQINPSTEELFSVCRKPVVVKHVKMGAVNLKTLILLTCLSSVLGFNLTRIADECLKGIMLSETENLKCNTAKDLSVQMIKTRSQSFYCIKYEKKSGNPNDVDVLSFDLNEDDYDLKFVRNKMKRD